MLTDLEWFELAVAAVGVVLAALLVTAEAALQSFSKSRAQRLLEQGKGGAKALVRITEDPAPTLNTLLFGRILAEIVAIVLVALFVFGRFEQTWERVLYSVGIMVLVSFILLGVAPRTLGRQKADAVALAAARPVSLLTTVLGPIPQVMILIGNALTPGRGFADGPFSSEAELRELVDIAEASDVIEAGERRMIHSVFDLGDTIVKEVMVPRTQMVYIERTKTVRQGVSLALRSGFSRIPVIGEDVDDVCGILYLKDAMRRMYDNPRAQATETVESLMRPPTFCPDSKPVDELLREMQLNRSHVVIVVDEFGGTAGLATIEDILEEIVGEIVDEYDQEVPPSVEIGPNRFRVSARLSVDDLGELFGKKVDDDDVDTVLGLMGKELNKVPIPGSVIEWEGIQLVAERGIGRRNSILTVLASLVEEPTDDPADEGVDAAAQLASESAERAS
ncbi:hemolysin family protein [Micropruina sonneratiae]|uniref:hemolysin family protein n=1 Tax=Micropruina sonneratiae TaxID=2986940 RepID=UPI0022263F41|nr:hemolysin family protein [Micropruina sp. KQZ13P-5]MCW3158471.1 hemolysin family protein [Micropruina sp. KQZ13P-5]